MGFDPELVSASERIAEAVQQLEGVALEKRAPLPAGPLAVFNGALEEGARLGDGTTRLGRKHGPLALPALICALELDDLGASQWGAAE
jgi:hypothetical protein